MATFLMGRHVEKQLNRGGCGQKARSLFTETGNHFKTQGEMESVSS